MSSQQNYLSCENLHHLQKTDINTEISHTRMKPLWQLLQWAEGGREGWGDEDVFDL